MIRIFVFLSRLHRNLCWAGSFHVVCVCDFSLWDWGPKKKKKNCSNWTSYVFEPFWWESILRGFEDIKLFTGIFVYKNILTSLCFSFFLSISLCVVFCAFIIQSNFIQCAGCEMFFGCYRTFLQSNREKMFQIIFFFFFYFVRFSSLYFPSALWLQFFDIFFFEWLHKRFFHRFIQFSLLVYANCLTLIRFVCKNFALNNNEK